MNYRHLARHLLRPGNRYPGTSASGTSHPTPSAWKGEIVVMAGTVDEDVRYLFTHGQCHALALAGHEVTRWPVIWAGDWEDGADAYYPDHLYLLHPSDMLLDVNGLHEIDEVLQMYETVRALDSHSLRSCVFVDYPIPAMALARTLFPVVLEQAEAVRAAAHEVEAGGIDL